MARYSLKIRAHERSFYFGYGSVSQRTVDRYRQPAGRGYPLEVRLKRLYARKSLMVILYCALFLSAFSVRITHISHFAFWPDEGVQAFIISHGFSQLVDLAASNLNQPPLDGCLELIGLHCFGYNEVGMRIHAVLAGSLACLLFFVFLNSCYGIPGAVLGYVIFTFNPWLIRYSFEGRPYSTAILCTVLFIFIFHRYFINDSPGNFVCLVIAQLLLLSSIGAQSLLLLFAFVFSSIITCLFFKENVKFKKAFYIFLSFLLAFALFLPFFCKTLKGAETFISHDKDLVSKIAVLVQKYSTIDFVRFYQFTDDYKYLAAACLAFYILAIFLRRRYKTLTPDNTTQLKLILLGVFFLFPFFFHFIFNMTLKERSDHIIFAQRYILVFIPITIAVISIGFNDLVLMTGQEIKPLRFRSIIYMLIAASLACMFGNNLANNRKFLAKQFPNQNPSVIQPSSWVELNEGCQEYSPGMTVELYGNVYVTPLPHRYLDVYLLIWPTPEGAKYSILSDGKVVKGVKPRQVISAPCRWYGAIWQPVVAKGTPAGLYTVGLYVLPSGAPFNADDAIASASAEILITK